MKSEHWPNILLETVPCPSLQYNHCTCVCVCVWMKTHACDCHTINSAKLIHFSNYPFSAVLWACMPHINNNHTTVHPHSHPYLLASPWRARLLLCCPCALQESIKTSDFLTNTLLVDKMTSICCLSDVSGQRYVFHEKIKNNGLWVRA